MIVPKKIIGFRHSQILDFAVHRSPWTLLNVAGSPALQAVAIDITVTGLGLAKSPTAEKHERQQSTKTREKKHFSTSYQRQIELLTSSLKA